MQTDAMMRTEGKRTPVLRLLALACLTLLVGLSAAEAQGKRLGLVIGLADYGDVKHPTALQDAGLVAQSLKQDGFELMEAANLTQSEFRAMFRDFTERAGAAGPDAVLAVYISGVALQDDGENILLPVGARLRQRSDLALEGLRVGDFLRSLSSLPASARIVMLDASYTHPLGQLVAEGGQGLAPAEKRDGLLVSYNQSPDQVATLPRTNYGHYAMALAEALREPGLDTNGIFERVRLRVHDLSQGAETPWAVSGLSAPLILVPGVAGAPVAAQTQEFIEARRKPIGQLGADDAYSRAIELDTIPAYEEFLKAYPSHVQAKRVRAMIAARREAYTWQRARRTNTDRAYWTYLRRYPNGAHAAEAESRLARLAAPVVPPPQFEEVIYDDLPPPLPEELEIYESVVIENRWGMLPPPTGYSDRFLPPPPIEIIELAPPPPNPSSRLLPAVVIGAGVVGAAILANRAWKRPAEVRPVVAPPVMRPPRVPGQFGIQQPVRPPMGQPPVGAVQQPVAPLGGMRPPIGQPPVGVVPPVGGVQQPVVPPGGVRPPGSPPVGVVPPVGQPPVGQPGAIRPLQPGAVPNAPSGLPRPGAIPPQGGLRPPQAPNAPGAPVQTAPPPATSGQPGALPPSALPPGAAPQGRPLVGAPPSVSGAPLGGPRPPQAPTAPVAAPPTGPRPVRQVPLTQSPQMRPSPPPANAPRYMPVPQRPAPQVRQGPVPQYRQAPPPQVRQAPPPQVRQAPPPQQFRAPPPMMRQAPPPQARPAPPPAARPCTPQMRAARQC
ncbi:MAG: hypothetical protein CFE31_06760 [Rhizobiales bacterium PAR1]|nr:MAG: hypothetical protein CFE31_06760 [Rhizobiales bacterium PAR1]